jgi:hypothetical protein
MSSLHAGQIERPTEWKYSMQDDKFFFGQKLRQSNETQFTAYRSVNRRNVKKGKDDMSARRLFSTKHGRPEHWENIHGG